jgi:hypothetical protein
VFSVRYEIHFSTIYKYFRFQNINLITILNFIYEVFDVGFFYDGLSATRVK